MTKQFIVSCLWIASLWLAMTGSCFSTAQAARFSGDYLLQVCVSDKEGKELLPGSHVACQAYIAGILDYHNLIKSLGTAPSVDFCVPDGVGLTEIQHRVASYLYRNKHEQGPFIASPGVALALFQAFPCDANGNPAKRKPFKKPEGKDIDMALEPPAIETDSSKVPEE